MWAIQYKDDKVWKTSIRELKESTLQVFMLKDEAEKEFKSYEGHAFEHRLVEVEIFAKDI